MSDPFYVDGDFTTPSAVSDIRILTPFAEQGDVTPYIFEQDFECYRANYAPLALDTAHPTIADAYLVADGLNMTSDLGETVRWTRRYAKVPAQRKEYESFPWNRPGLSQNGSGAIVYVASASYNSATTTITITTQTAHGLSVGDGFYIYFSNSTSALKPIGYYAGKVTTVVSSTEITAQMVNPGDGINNLYAILKANDLTYTVGGTTFYVLGRPPRTKSVPSEIVYDYYLPGVTPGISTVDDIPILPAFVVYDPYQQESQMIDLYTTPTIVDYVTDISSGTKLVAADSVTRRWQGNIIERVTRYVTAQ